MTDEKEIILFEFPLTNIVSGETILFIVYAPRHAGSGDSEKYISRYDVVRGESISIRYAYSENQMSAALLAIDGIRRVIPDKEDQAWETREGLPVWLILPRPAQVSWGYRLYRDCVDALEAIEENNRLRIEDMKSRSGHD